MKEKQPIFAVLLFSILLALAACKKDNLQHSSTQPSKPENPPPKSSGTPYSTYAEQTHVFISGNLMTPYFSYRGNTTSESNNAFEWYNVSQIYADAAGVDPNYGNNAHLRSYMDSTYAWMGHMWDTGSPIGGYFSAANLDGSGAGGDKYVDDCGVTINAYLDAYYSFGNDTSSAKAQAYLTSAKACANWLMNNGLWTTASGGGFYQRTGTGAVKPTQTNGLIMQSFLRLYKSTGQSNYKSWAISVKNWLETYMYDNASGLYIWQYEPNGVRDTAKFTYDNAIMVEADLLYYQVLGDASYKKKAEDLGIAMNSKLWSRSAGVYIFNTQDYRVNPAWCVWASQAMIRLYEADGNSTWLDYAQKNIDFMNSKLRVSSNYGYHTFCDLSGGSIDARFEAVDQAWMERTQFLLSKYR